VRTLRLEKNIIFHPSRPFLANKILLLQQAWIHALPSMKEGFGLSILEAAACETPTVAYDVTGVRDAVMQGETGLLARAGDISSFTTHLIDLLTNQDKRKLLGKQAAKWSANYSWAKSADKFVEVIRATDVHSREIVRSYVPNSSIGVTSPVA
jgi:glycosyltransferase involved in cell wall biosynthesis